MLTYVPLPVRGERIPVTGREIHATAKVWPIFARSMLRFARHCTADHDDREELVEVSMVALWNEDPTRWDFGVDENILRMNRRLIRRMENVWAQTEAARAEDQKRRAQADAIRWQVREDARRVEAEAKRTLRRTLAEGGLPS